MMSQDDRWNQHCAELMAYVMQQGRLPSRHRVEARRLLNWLKYNRKCLSAGTLPADRHLRFQQLEEFLARHHHVNQYQ